MKLIIVESPTKAKTLSGFLGKEYSILSSFGHIRDLPKGKLGIDTEKNFAPTYVIPTKARKILTALKKESANADEVILATDEDREGEAIAWHLAFALGLKNPKRIVFHEITKEAINNALQTPRTIDDDKVDAQQARRILDRLVGYKLSPFLWEKIARRLSAGRVQSAAVRLVADREQEIKDFKPQEYWSIEAKLQKEKLSPFFTQLAAKNEKPIAKLEIETEQQANAILKDLKNAEYTVTKVKKKEMRRNPLPPFTTSTLQQTAWQHLHFSAKATMALAQKLYETGLITYHRTDSLSLSAQSLNIAESIIKKAYGKEYWTRRTFKTKSKGAQEAHEAIRPSYPEKTPESINNLDDRTKKLYELIWKRFMASQMNQAVFDATTIDIQAKNYTFRATGQTLKFEGFLKIYPMKFEETELPTMAKGDVLKLIELVSDQHFTQPSSRYTEATLVKAMESYGIGRPSTYAPTLSTIQDRNYVEKDDKKRFVLTEMGKTVNDMLVKHFPNIVDLKFTARMEEDLDKIAEGKKQWTPIIKEFYEPFEKNLEKKYKEVEKQTVEHEVTDKKCPKCNSPIIIRFGRFGKFYACSSFPECKHTEPLEKKTLGIQCPRCKKGELAAKRTKAKRTFCGCDSYPECDFALWDKPTGEICKDCGSLLVEKNKRIRCSNPDCTKAK